MARLNDHLDSEDELPELSNILGLQTGAITRTQPETRRQEHGEIPSQRKETQNLELNNLLTERRAIVTRTLTEDSSDKPQSRKQRPLGHLRQAHVNSLLLPTSDAFINKYKKAEVNPGTEAVVSVSGRANSEQLATSISNSSRLTKVSANAIELVYHDDYPDTDLSGFIVPDSASDGEVLASRKSKKNEKMKKQKSRSPKPFTANLCEPGFQEFKQPSRMTNLFLPEEKDKSGMCLESPPSHEPFRSELGDAHPNLDDHLAL